MRVAVIGSRNLHVEISKYMPENITEIVSGGVSGIDTLAEQWADIRHMPKLIIRADYTGDRGRAASLWRGKLIVEAAELVLAIWDGKSRGTKRAVDYAKRIGKPVQIVLMETQKERERT